MEIPIHDNRRLDFSSPKELEQRLKEYPLNKDFIDWVASQGYTVRFLDMIPAGGVYQREILIRRDQFFPVTHDFVLMHELVHIAVPTPNHRYEYAIDRIAKKYAEDKEFVDYVKKTIKIQNTLIANNGYSRRVKVSN